MCIRDRGHVILKEYFADRQVDFSVDYNRRYTDLPFLISLEQQDDGSYAAGKFVVAGDLSPSVVSEATSENAMWKPVLLDGRTDAVAVPRGSVGFRYGDEGLGQWNLDLGDIEPVLSVLDTREGEALVRFPRFDAPDGTVAFETRGVPIRRIGDRVVTTVLDLLLAHYGVARDGLPGAWPTGYDDASVPATPAWASEITGVPAEQITRLAREWAQNAIDTEGRGMILMLSLIHISEPTRPY